MTECAFASLAPQTSPRGLVDLEDSSGDIAAHWLMTRCCLPPTYPRGGYAAATRESSTTADTDEAVLSTDTTADPVITTTEAAPETTVSTQPFVEFDGESCTYSGPSEFEVGTLPRFEARNTGSVDFSVVVLQIDAGLSYQEVVARAGGFRGNRPDLPEGIQAGNGSGVMGPGDEQGFNVGFSASGNYLPACERWPDHTYFLAEGFVTVP